MSVYRSYAKCVLGTKTLTLPTQDNGRLSGPPTELCSYHDNHSQQWPDSACQGKLRTRQLPVEASTEHCCFTQGVVSKQPPSYPTSFDPQASSTHPLLEQSLGYPAVSSCTDQDVNPPTFFDTGLAWSRRQTKTQWSRFNEIRQIYRI